jgi:Tfp pilus assembly protein PilF
VYEKMGNIQEAIKDFEKAVAEDRRAHASFHALAMLADRDKEHLEALDYFDQAVAIDPKNAIYWHNRVSAGNLCLRMLAGECSRALRAN